MRLIRRTCVIRGLFFSLLFVPAIVNSQYWEFGQNKVQYREVDWKVIDSDKFSILYYPEGSRLVNFAYQVMLDSYNRLSNALSYTPQEPIPVILYASHNDFEQTNVTLSLIDETTGGFTEIFKNRVVVPFDGSYENFRHVLSHELTHAFQFGMTRGEGFTSLIPRISLYNMPLWFIEGMAEYFSLGWDAESDMIMRDALYHDKLVPIQKLHEIEGSYLMYKEGQSILYFIATHYGEPKVGELFRKIGLSVPGGGSLDKSLQSVFGVDIDELNRLWLNDLKKRYWARCAKLDVSPGYARRLTHHKDYTFNTAPSISPDGSEIAFLSDRDEYESLYLMSTIDGRIKCKLVSGGKTKGFESLHIMRGGGSWSPDGKLIAFVAKGGGKDILYLMGVKSKKIIRRFPLPLDGIFSPSFAPMGNFIALRGLKDGESDIYILNLETGTLTPITHDQYDDLTPNWAPDGKSIIFSSDRPSTGADWHYGQYTLFKTQIDTDKREWERPYPLLKKRATYVTSPMLVGDKILFVSNQSGVNNLYLLDTLTSNLTQLTNVLGGTFTPSISNNGKYLAFSAYTDMGWDIYIMKNPLTKDMECQADSSFDRQYTKVISDTSKPKSHKLGLRFTPDWGGGAVSYVYGGGIYGNLRLAVSDLLGNHRFYLETNTSENLAAADYYISYLYLPHRLDFGIYTFKQEYYWLRGDILSWEKIQGGGALFEYPLDKFSRIDLAIEGSKFKEEEWWYPEWEKLSGGERHYYFSGLSLAWVTDNSIWGPIGPQNGARYKIGLSSTLPIISPTLLYNSYKFDFRKYIRIVHRYSFATRLSHAGIWGKDKEQVYMLIGGPANLRGYDIGEFEGKNIGCLNLELRYPFIDKLKIAFPIPLSISGIRGVVFCDLGYAVNDIKKFKPFEQGALNDLYFDFGTGIRLGTPWFILKFDIAKNTNFVNLSKETYMYISLGPEF